jgi:RNA polymerase sigma-70 factor (ECF subfamily)
VSRTGDLQAFEELVARYQRRLFGLCYRLLGREGDAYHDAEDASQEAFLRAYRSLSLYDPARPFDRWLLTIAANCCVSMLRRRRPKTMEAAEGDEEAGAREAGAGSVTRSPGPPEEAEGRELAQAVARAIAGLEDTYRLPFVLFHQEGMTYEDICQALGLPLWTVNSRVHRARAQLYDQLARAGFLKEGSPR